MAHAPDAFSSLCSCEGAADARSYVAARSAFFTIRCDGATVELAQGHRGGAPLTPKVKPRQLLPGDKVATVSLSWGGPGAFRYRYEAGKSQLEEVFGVSVVESRHCLADPQWIYENPQARADDLMECFEDITISAIIATIGGDDSIRILPYIDLDVIKNNPKVFMGYSDSTICHFACFRAGIVSYYGPSIMAGFAENCGLFPYMERSVHRTLFASEPVGTIKPNLDGWTVEFLDWGKPEHQEQRRRLKPSSGWRWLQGEGKAAGHLIGGCLEVLDWLRGTDYWPPLDEWEGALLFLEPSEEAPSPEYVLRFFRSLESMGILARLNGLLFGRPGGQITDEERIEYDQALIRAISKEAGRTTLPIVANMDFGHTDPIMTLPYGVTVEIDCDAQVLRIPESATSSR